MYPRAKVEKVELKNLDSGKTFKLPFNPSSISITRGCNVSDKEAKGPMGDSFASVSSSGPKCDDLSFEFFLDTSEPELTDGLNLLNMMNPIILSSLTLVPPSSMFGPPPVTEDLETLLTWTDVLKETKKPGMVPRPPVVFFKWGDSIKFTGMISEFKFDITLFDSDGVARRAKVNMGIKGGIGEKKVEEITAPAGESKATSKGSLS